MSYNLEEVVFIIYYYHYVLKISKYAFNPNSILFGFVKELPIM